MEPVKELPGMDARPDSRLNDGEKMLFAMKKLSASDLRVSNNAIPAFRIAGAWRRDGKELAEDLVRRCLAGLLTEAEFQNLLSGIDIKKAYVLAGVGDFLLNAYLRDGKPVWTAARA